MSRSPSVRVKAPPTEAVQPPLQLGAKGRRTRQRIMAATAELLRERAAGDIKITEISRVAGVTQPNFYTYFESVEAVVLALAEDFLHEPQGLDAFFAEDWAGPGGLEAARGLVKSAIQVIERNRPLLGFVNFLADKGHGEFQDMRVRIWRRLYKAFENEVRKGQAAGRISRTVQPRLAGYECVGLVTSISVRYELLRESGFSHGQLVNTTAALLRAIATGQGPDGERRG
jgi:AcrR family transcriptional regulator